MINQTEETGIETFAALPRYQSKAAVRSAICNGGPGLLDDIPGCTGEDSLSSAIPTSRSLTVLSHPFPGRASIPGRMRPANSAPTGCPAGYTTSIISMPTVLRG